MDPLRPFKRIHRFTATPPADCRFSISDCRLEEGASPERKRREKRLSSCPLEICNRKSTICNLNPNSPIDTLAQENLRATKRCRFRAFFTRLRSGIRSQESGISAEDLPADS